MDHRHECGVGFEDVVCEGDDHNYCRGWGGERETGEALDKGGEEGCWEVTSETEECLVRCRDEATEGEGLTLTREKAPSIGRSGLASVSGEHPCQGKCIAVCRIGGNPLIDVVLVLREESARAKKAHRLYSLMSTKSPLSASKPTFPP